MFRRFNDNSSDLTAEILIMHISGSLSLFRYLIKQNIVIDDVILADSIEVEQIASL